MNKGNLYVMSFKNVLFFKYIHKIKYIKNLYSSITEKLHVNNLPRRYCGKMLLYYLLLDGHPSALRHLVSGET